MSDFVFDNLPHSSDFVVRYETLFVVLALRVEIVVFSNFIV